MTDVLWLCMLWSKFLHLRELVKAWSLFEVFSRVSILVSKMAYENGLLNPGFAASTMSLHRRSNTSLNTISNSLYSEADSNSLYNTLQRDTNIAVTPRLRVKEPIYDKVKPGANLQSRQEKAATSQQTLQKRQSVRRKDKIIRLTVMCLIIFVAAAALLLALLLFMGKIGPNCSCDSTGTGKSRKKRNS